MKQSVLLRESTNLIIYGSFSLNRPNHQLCYWLLWFNMDVVYIISLQKLFVANIDWGELVGNIAGVTSVKINER